MTTMKKEEAKENVVLFLSLSSPRISRYTYTCHRVNLECSFPKEKKKEKKMEKNDMTETEVAEEVKEKKKKKKITNRLKTMRDLCVEV